MQIRWKQYIRLAILLSNRESNQSVSIIVAPLQPLLDTWCWWVLMLLWLKSQSSYQNDVSVGKTVQHWKSTVLCTSQMRQIHVEHNCKRVNIGLPLLLTWISNHIPSKVSKITYSFLHVNGATIEVWELMNYFTPRTVRDVIIYPCWDWS